jgi:L-aspartate oxidase
MFRTTDTLLPVMTTDFLVIGSGVAGLCAAIELSQYGKVLVLTKAEATAGSTGYAQGGIAVALSEEDEIIFHYEDTIAAGAGLCDEKAVSVLVEEGPERIREMISWGAQFDRVGAKLAFTREAAHSKNRIVHAQGDSTGKEVERTLLSRVKTLKNVRKLDFHVTIDLFVQEGVCMGAFLLDEKGRKVYAVTARATILATGGAGYLYHHTSNPTVATGDGMAMAFRGGAELADMEFVQFHPTTLYFPGAPFFLLSEAMRGEGGRLLNIYEKEFVHKYHPDKELAPRDIVSRAIVTEMAETHSPHVYLDLTHLAPAFVRKRFPQIYATCLSYGIDISQEKIPVSPSAHYMMGGIRTDLDGAATLPGLYAAGEVACTGVHGANRLASNSLLEGVVFGARAGKASARYAEKITALPGSVANPFRDRDLRGKDDRPEVDQVRGVLRKMMWDEVGIIRSKASLSRALESIEEWDPLLSPFYPYRRGLELQNMITVADLITRAALKREESVGAHYRTDFPPRADASPRYMRQADS